MAQANEIDQHQFLIADNAAARIHSMLENDKKYAFRISVEGGGCSGFQYDFSLAEAPNEDDIEFKNGEARILIDETSIEFLEGARLEWVEDLLGSSFRVKNPNARSSCGCGISFSV
ncbi:HesB/IscA family protein [Pseudaquidulcibacter saccharophilus]|uniref:HesB/IscA family protein n=1 Tax=Pseudaquidulcibacter saccharophilus TaxID=2831900 RepID=UPI001EFF3282|nr:iron-sulfur cluster assembly accessory protein [Pseudaquidulcibacter saccharophilus]